MQASSAQSAPSLAGITIVSMAEQYPGPLCTRVLGELGAEIILIERPGIGDPQRQAGAWLFRATNIGKKSVTLNLKLPAAQEAARRLITSADAFVEGFRPGVMARLGLGWDHLRALNPKLVYCSISGFGQEGPGRDLSGHNINYEAITGVLDPYLDPANGLGYFAAGVPFGDVMGAMTAALGIVAGIRAAEQSGAGRYLDISITDAMVMTLAPNLCRGLNGDARNWPLREPGYALYRTRDGLVALGIAHEDHFWRDLCQELALHDVAALTHRERLARVTEITGRVQAAFALRGTDECVAALNAVGVPCTKANTLQEVAEVPHFQERGLFGPALDEQGKPFVAAGSPFCHFDANATPAQVPPLGGASVEVLRRLGYDDAQIAAMQ